VKAEMITVAQTKKEMEDCLSDSFSVAEKEIVGVVSPPLLLGNTDWASVLSQMRTGVVYRRITIIDEFLRHEPTTLSQEITEFGVELFLVEKSQINQQFYVIDGRRVTFFNPSSTPGEFEFAGQVIDNTDLAVRFRREFDRLKNMSIPARFIVEYVGHLTNSSLESTVSGSEVCEGKAFNSENNLRVLEPFRLNQGQQGKTPRRLNCASTCWATRTVS